MSLSRPKSVRLRAELQNLRLLIWLRWVALTGMAIVVAFTHFALKVPLPLWNILAVLGFLVAVNLTATWRLRRSQGPWARALVADLLTDVAALTILLFLTGGAQNPFTGLLILQAVAGAFLLPPVEAGVVFVATVAAQFFLLHYGLPLALPMQHSHGGPNPHDLHLQGMFLSFFFSGALAVLFILGIKENLRRRDERLAQIARQMEEEQVIMRLGLLAGTAAHDIGTPLTNLAVILDDWQDLGLPEPQERARQIALMQEAIATCRESLSHMLAMGRQARVEAAHPADPVALLREIAMRWQARYPEIDLAVEGEEGGTLGPVLSDVLLTRALTNLLDNAREAGARRIVIAVTPEDGKVAIRIRDDGSGFPESILQDRAPGATAPEAGQGGHGLGLFLVRSALRRIGGGLRLANPPEGGAEVTVMLPQVAHGAG